MGLLKALEEVFDFDGPMGEVAATIVDGIFECGHSIADSLDDFAVKLGELETELAGEDGEESCWAIDRLAPEWEETPKMTALRDAVDSIVGFCDNAADWLNTAALDLTARSMDD